MQFEFSARNRDGKTVSGRADAVDQAQLKSALANQGLALISCKVLGSAPSVSRATAQPAPSMGSGIAWVPSFLRNIQSAIDAMADEARSVALARESKAPGAERLPWTLPSFLLTRNIIRIAEALFVLSLGVWIYALFGPTSKPATRIAERRGIDAIIPADNKVPLRVAADVPGTAPVARSLMLQHARADAMAAIFQRVKVPDQTILSVAAEGDRSLQVSASSTTMAEVERVVAALDAPMTHTTMNGQILELFTRLIRYAQAPH